MLTPLFSLSYAGSCGLIDWTSPGEKKVIAATGMYTDDDEVRNCEVFDFAQGQWDVLPPLMDYPFAVTWTASAIINGVIHVYKGWNGPYYSFIYKFKPGVGWEFVGDFPYNQFGTLKSPTAVMVFN